MNDRMTITVDAGEIRIDLADYISTLTGEERTRIIDTLACQQEVIDEVVNQIVDGCTTLGSHGATGLGGDATCRYGLDGARRRIAEAAGDIARKELDAAQRRLESAQALGRKGWDAYHELLQRGRM